MNRSIARRIAATAASLFVTLMIFSGVIALGTDSYSGQTLATAFAAARA